MAGRGGPRPGSGRRRGGKNKITIERAIVAEQVLARTSMAGKKLAKEVLDEFMGVFAGMAATYQPLQPGTPIPPGHTPDDVLFEKWARLTIETASALAKYQSPTFKAVQVIAPSSDHEKPVSVPGSNVVSINDPGRTARVYRQLIGVVRG